jgi:dTDP-4-dehydrorhamnose reductase
VLGHEALVGLGIEPIGDWEERWAESATAVLAT